MNSATLFVRHQFGAIIDRLSYFPGVVLLGPRQVGKTTLARGIAAALTGTQAVDGPGPLFLDLEVAADRAKLAQPATFLAANRHRLVVLDEVQNLPDLFTVLRPEIDSDRRPGRFLLLGSASGKLLRQSAESLAGRVSYVELSALMADEIEPRSPARNPRGPMPLELRDLLELWLRGGFPLSYLAPTDAMSLTWRNDFIQTFLRRDLPGLGVGIPGETLWRFWRMVAHHHGQIFNASRIAASLGGLSHTTVARYLDLLCDAMVMRRLEPLYVNLGKRLVKSPKVYVRDSGMLHALLNIGTANDLQGHPMAGHSWEGMALEHIAARAPADAQISFYRTTAGAELDVVVETGLQKVGFEIKFSEAPKMTKGFWQACEDVGVDRAYVVAPVREGWKMAGNVEVIPLTGVETTFAGPGRESSGGSNSP